MDNEEKTQDFETTSPVPQSPTLPVTYLFFDALREVLSGRKITRQVWDSKDIYGYLKDGVLRIFGGEIGDGKEHNWILSEGDMFADDWIILPEGN